MYVLMLWLYHLHRFKQKPPLPWSAINTAVGVLTIVLLIAHIFHAAINRIDKVVYDYQEMRILKVRAEAADVAKSQVRSCAKSLFEQSYLYVMKF